MIIHKINPVLVSFMGLEIKYYGLVYLIGFLIAFFIFKKYFKKNKELYYTATLYFILGVIIGARLFHVLGDIDYYSINLARIFYFWKGGMTFYGGFIGVMASLYLFCKRYKQDFLRLTDKIVLFLPLILILGRLANFINSELYGKITSVRWCVVFQSVEGCRHPSQLYEAIAHVLIFAMLFIIYKQQNKKSQPKKGVLSFSFLLLYGFTRFFVDLSREYEKIYLGLSVSQYLNVLVFLAGLIGILLIRKNTKSY